MIAGPSVAGQELSIQFIEGASVGYNDETTDDLHAGAVRCIDARVAGHAGVGSIPIRMANRENRVLGDGGGRWSAVCWPS
jgi:hypothetical protein